MREKKNFLKTSSSISASILSFAVSIVGFSSFQIIEWWHYLVVSFAVFFFYLVFLILIELSAGLYNRYIKRANISINIEAEVNALENAIDSLYDMSLKYDSSTNAPYQEILYKEIFTLYNSATKKIAMIERFSDSPTLKNKYSVDSKLFKEYKKFCEYIAKKFAFS